MPLPPGRTRWVGTAVGLPGASVWRTLVAVVVGVSVIAGVVGWTSVWVGVGELITISVKVAVGVLIMIVVAVGVGWLTPVPVGVGEGPGVSIRRYSRINCRPGPQ